MLTSPHQCTGVPLGSSKKNQGLPIPKDVTTEQKQGRNDGGTSAAGRLASDKSPKDKFGDQEGLQVAFMHSELTCNWEHVEKIAILPQELTLLCNKVESAQGDLGVMGMHLVVMLRLSKNVVESKLVSRSTKDKIASARVDIVRIGDDVYIARADVLGVDCKILVMAIDIAALKHDVNVVKCDVVSIRKDLGVFKSELATIAAGVQAIQWSLESTSVTQYRDIGMSTEVEHITTTSLREGRRACGGSRCPEP